MRVNVESNLVLTDFRKKYRERFPNTDLHHPMPRSRMPRTATKREIRLNKSLVFPYQKESHSAYHDLLWNLRIDQVWKILERIHPSIFKAKSSHIKQWWIEFCDLESGLPKRRKEFYKSKGEKLEKTVETAHLRGLWLKAFGSEDLAVAENLLKITMLFMISGTTILNKRKLLSDRYLRALFKKSKFKGIRLWAFQTVFGGISGEESTQRFRSQIVSILGKNKFYASRIL